LHTPDGDVRFRLPLPGRHNVMNALAASAAAQAAGASLADIRAGLAGLVPVAGRFNIHHLPGDITVIDDTYNANPGSLQVALDVLGMTGGTTWLVLGDMGELGEDSTALHAAAGRGAREVGVDRVFTLGELAQAAADSFGGQGESFQSLDALTDALTEKLQGPLHILVKGSRRMRMERVVETLLSWRGV
jgi:UDP-N-acetylmuramoyl-tripeptide--D-alanyl-D-alanine ligase